MTKAEWKQLAISLAAASKDDEVNENEKETFVSAFDLAMQIHDEKA